KGRFADLRNSRAVLIGEAADEFRVKAAYDPTTLPDIGVNVIEPDRDPDLVRSSEPDILTIRDVMNVSPTTSDAVRFTKYEVTRGAASQQGRGGEKGYMKFEVSALSV